MQQYIHRYFVTHLALDEDAALLLHQQYFKEYGLAIEGLVRHHKVDAMAYNQQVDDALPLHHILKPDLELRKLLLSIDRTKVKKLWLFTNAYKTHGLRVVELLGISDLFDGITYCDYSQFPLLCKPKSEMFEKAMQESETPSSDNCIYIDDSGTNITGAHKFGWHKTIHYVDPDDQLPAVNAGHHFVRDLLGLPTILPEIFIKRFHNEW